MVWAAWKPEESEYPPREYALTLTCRALLPRKSSTNGLFRPEVFVDTVKLDSFEIFAEETSK